MFPRVPLKPQRHEGLTRLVAASVIVYYVHFKKNLDFDTISACFPTLYESLRNGWMFSHCVKISRSGETPCANTTCLVLYSHAQCDGSSVATSSKVDDDTLRQGKFVKDSAT